MAQAAVATTFACQHGFQCLHASADFMFGRLKTKEITSLERPNKTWQATTHVHACTTAHITTSDWLAGA